MEEDIKILEEHIEFLKRVKDMYGDFIEEIKALENLLKAYKELKEENKELKENCKKCVVRDRLHEYVENTILKSKVKEKIEELDKRIEEAKKNIKETIDEEKLYWKRERHDLCMQKNILNEFSGEE